MDVNTARTAEEVALVTLQAAVATVVGGADFQGPAADDDVASTAIAAKTATLSSGEDAATSAESSER